MMSGGSKNIIEFEVDKQHRLDDSNTEGDSDDLDEDEIGNIFGDIGGHLNDIDPKQNPLLWVQSQITQCVNPRTIIRQLIPEFVLPDDVPELSVWRFIFEIITEPAPRQRLLHVFSLENVVNLIKECKNIVILTGAGVSVSCGIPDFRSRNGIYARLRQDFPDLPDPQSMFDIHFFRCNPCPFFRFAKEIYPGRFAPSLSHRFIQTLESSGRLLRNYTQNIDTLEQVAGIKNVVHCHGSFATATCMNCKFKVNAGDIEADVFAQRIPYCKTCTPNTDGVMNILKPDIVFFGEGLPDEFHKRIEEDKEKADLLIVMGSSLKVRPVALIPSFLKPGVPQILINREPLPHMRFDVELYGNCDDVINELCCQLGEEWGHVTESFIPNPVDVDRYKSFFPVNINGDATDADFTQINGHSVCNTLEPAATDSFSNDEVWTLDNKGEAVCSEHILHSTGSVSCNENSEDSLKRKEVNSDGCSLKNKKQKMTGDSNSTYYLSLPPNSYIFYGAEMECVTDSDSDNDEYGNNTAENKGDSELLIPGAVIEDVPCNTSSSESVSSGIQTCHQALESADKVLMHVTNTVSTTYDAIIENVYTNNTHPAIDNA